MFGVIFLLTQYFQFVLGYSPLEAGIRAPAGADDDGGGAAQRGSWSGSAPRSSCRADCSSPGSVFCRSQGSRCRRVEHLLASDVDGGRHGSHDGPGDGIDHGSLPLAAGVGSAVNDTTFRSAVHWASRSSAACSLRPTARRSAMPLPGSHSRAVWRTTPRTPSRPDRQPDRRPGGERSRARPERLSSTGCTRGIWSERRSSSSLRSGH